MSTGNETAEELVALLARAGSRTSGDYETTVRASLLDRASEYIKSTITSPETLTVQDGSALARSMFAMEPEPQDVRRLVLDMRDVFLTMVTGFNTVGAYEAAASAQTMAVALHTFECKHNITGLAWPLEVVREEGESPALRTVYENDNVRFGEDL